MPCYRVVGGGIVLSVRLTPRAGRDEIAGVASLADGREHLMARVRAVPERGAANKALAELLARALNVPKSAVSLVSGSTARLKQVRIAGAPAELVEVVKSWSKSPPSPSP